MSDGARHHTWQKVGGREVEITITPAMLKQLQQGGSGRPAPRRRRGGLRRPTASRRRPPHSADIDSSTVLEVRLTVAKG